jgi:tyrosine recombinase XerC
MIIKAYSKKPHWWSESFNQFIDYLNTERLYSPHTVRNYKKDLSLFLTFCEKDNASSFTEVDRSQVENWIFELTEKNTARSSISRNLSAIRSFWKFLEQSQILDNSNMIRRIPSPKKGRTLPRFLSQLDVQKLILAPRKLNETQPGKSKLLPSIIRDEAILELLYASGLRVSEISNLDLADINMKDRTTRVLGKGNKERETIFGDKCAAILDQYIQTSRPSLNKGKNSLALFLNHRGSRLSVRGFELIVKKWAILAGLGNSVHPHTLRHSFATHLLDGGANLRTVQELLGHSSLETTEIYTHVTQSQMAVVYSRAHPGMNRL